MNTKVVKFGGSSVADANQIKKVKEILYSEDSRKYCVVSAAGKRNSNDEKSELKELVLLDGLTVDDCELPE